MTHGPLTVTGKEATFTMTSIIADTYLRKTDMKVFTYISYPTPQRKKKKRSNLNRKSWKRTFKKRKKRILSEIHKKFLHVNMRKTTLIRGVMDRMLE